jgi:hypothetical protein
MFQSNTQKYIMSANFQDIYQLTKRTGEVRTKMDQIRFRAQGIGGMLGIAGGAMGGPLGSVIGFGIGRTVGSFVGNMYANKTYGEEQKAINENLVLANHRNSQLNYQYAVHNALGEMLDTIVQNEIKDEQKILQEVLVL